MLINYNGKLYNAEDPVLRADNRSFLYGDGIFESMRMINGKIIFLNSHLQRLYRGMNLLRINIPDHFNAEYFSDKINELTEQNNIASGNARVRVNVFRSDGGLYAPVHNSPHYVISMKEIFEKNFELNTTGLRVDLFTEIKKPLNILSEFKTCNSIIYVLAGIWKNKQLLDDCLILNENNRLCEGLNANVFLVKGSEIKTPAITEGCIKGVMRDQIIKLLRKNNYSVKEEPVETEELLGADEIFLTNASAGIRWIAAYKNKRYFCKYSKEIISELNNLAENEN